MNWLGRHIMCHDFLLEIGCEELPPNSLMPLSQALKDLIVTELRAVRLYYDQPEIVFHVYAAPRRLAVLIENLPVQTTPQEGKTSGPPISVAWDKAGNPTPAALGFAKKCNTDVTQLKTIMTDKGECLLFEYVTPSQNTIDLLPSITEKAVKALPILKPMRWGSHTEPFVRPVHWVVMLYENKVIPAKLLGCQSAQTTQGHRVHHPEPILLEVPKAYASKLRHAYVMADFNERKQTIREALVSAADVWQAEVIAPEALLDEVTGLVEWPVVLTVPLDEKFLALPRDVLIAAMQQHQKSFALSHKVTGILLPYFCVVANIESHDPEQVIAGNARVMQARLSDAVFFYETDKKQSLFSRRESLKQVIYQAKLGTLYDKTERFYALSDYLTRYFQVDAHEVNRAAMLSSCDLITDMVGEFPELQGIMGYYYAKADGESEHVAVALQEQYQPRFSGDQLPETALGTLLAIAERVDTLIGAFSIYQKPTGNKDPFKLRRHALGLIRLLIEKKIVLNLPDLLSVAFLQFPHHQAPDTNTNTVEETHAFIVERLKAYYHEQGFAPQVIQAVLMQQSRCLYDADQRIRAVQTFMTWPEADALAAANKRVSKILETTDRVTTIVPENLIEPAEATLVNALQEQQAQLPTLLEKQQYTEALKALSFLREPIDAFFLSVMVNIDDPKLRQNRLAILHTLRALFLTIADLSCLSIGTSKND